MLRLRSIVLGLAALVAAAGSSPVAKAADADWGCQVLLCAASSAPSWHQVPYCVPPMMKLITASHGATALFLAALPWRRYGSARV